VKLWIEIDEARLVGNFAALNRVLTDADGSEPAPALLAVVKANGYGHGIAACAPVLTRAGAQWLGVTDAEEGAAVREVLAEAGIAAALQPRILVMSGMMGLPGEAERIVRQRLTAVVWDATHLNLLAQAARRATVTEQVPVHLEIDTGMARQGVACGVELSQVLELLAATPELRLDGVFTHFASTEVAHAAQTRQQQRRFEAALAQVAASGLRPAWVHVGNSSFIDNGAEPGALAWIRHLAAAAGARAMVRAGLALYGYLLPIEAPAGQEVALVRPQVLPVMAWKTRVIGLRAVEPGATVGYNGIFVAECGMHLALLPVGYADGLRRELSGANGKPGGWVIIRGQRAPILGRVSMNLTVVDVSTLPGVSVGDEVVLLGDGVTAEDHARIAGTIAYEIVCGVRIRA